MLHDLRDEPRRHCVRYEPRLSINIHASSDVEDVQDRSNKDEQSPLRQMPSGTDSGYGVTLSATVWTPRHSFVPSSETERHSGGIANSGVYPPVLDEAFRIEPLWIWVFIGIA